MAVPRYLGTHAAALNLDLLDAAGRALRTPNCSDHEMATLAQALTRRGTHGRGQVAGIAGLKGPLGPSIPHTFGFRGFGATFTHIWPGAASGWERTAEEWTVKRLGFTESRWR